MPDGTTPSHHAAIQALSDALEELDRNYHEQKAQLEGSIRLLLPPGSDSETDTPDPTDSPDYPFSVSTAVHRAIGKSSGFFTSEIVYVRLREEYPRSTCFSASRVSKSLHALCKRGVIRIAVRGHRGKGGHHLYELVPTPK